MVQFTGQYDWALIDKDTGLTVDSGTQKNLINENFIYTLVRLNMDYPNPSADSALGVFGNLYVALQLSDSTPDPGTEYRDEAVTPGFNILAETSQSYPEEDLTINSFYVDNNFSPPVSPRTIKVIGISSQHRETWTYPKYNFVSFIELSTPVTQQTNHYLYVKYIMRPDININADYVPNTKYHTYALTRGVFYGVSNVFGRPENSFQKNRPMLIVSPWIEPVSKDYLQRNFWIRYFATNDGVKTITSYTGYTNSIIEEGSLSHALTYGATFDASSIVGPIGSLVVQANNAQWAYQFGGPRPFGNYPFFAGSLGYSPIENQGPSISRVFTHPSSRSDQIFSDPGYPAESEGTITLTGTPTCTWPMVVRVHVTKTGDASDIVDEDVDSSNVDSVTDQFTVTQVWGTGDTVRLTTTGTLPDPLAIDTDYYVIYIDDTHIKVASSYENSLAGTSISVNDSGSGVHTIIRQNTGEFNIQMEPWMKGSSNYTLVNHHTMAVDAENKMQPHCPVGYSCDVDVGEDLGNGDLNSAARDDNSILPGSLIRGVTHVGDFIYSIQRSRSGSYTLCRWRFNSSENAQALHSLTGISSVTWYRITHKGTDVYLAASDGIYHYDTNTPTTAPQLMTITGLAESTVTDLCFDPVTEYLWAGHTIGLSKIDLTTNIAIAYVSGAGGVFEGLASGQEYVYTGMLDVYNGRVLRGGSQEYNDRVTWVMDDASDQADVKWYVIPEQETGYGVYILGVCLERGTDNIVFRTYRNWYYGTVATTGKGTGSFTQVQTASGFNIEGNSFTYLGDQPLWGNLTFITDNLVCGTCMCATNNNAMMYYNIDTNTETPVSYGLGRMKDYNGYRSIGSTARRQCFPQTKEPIDIGYDQNLLVFFNLLIKAPWPSNISYGWDGAEWKMSDTGVLKIKKIATSSLPYEVSVLFSNAAGSPWDKQFVVDEDFTFMIAPCIIKDNLQTFDIKSRVYFCNTGSVADYATSIPGDPYQITIPETTDTDFNEMDTVELVTQAYDVAGDSYMTLVSDSPAAGEFSVSSEGVFTFNSADTGKSVLLTYTYALYS